MLLISTTEGPMVPARTLRSAFLPEEVSTSSNFESVMRGSCGRGDRRGPQRGLHGRRAEIKALGHTCTTSRASHGGGARCVATTARRGRYSMTLRYWPGWNLPVG